MAGSFNKVMLMGNLTRDIEVRHLQSGQAVGNIGLAVSRKFKGQDGELREETTFVDCEAWGRTAEVMAQYLHKGKPVFIEGRLKLDQWQDKEGGNRSKLKVVVENFRFIDSAQGGGGGGGGGERSSSASVGTRRAQPAASHAPAPSAADYDHVPDDDIPF